MTLKLDTPGKWLGTSAALVLVVTTGGLIQNLRASVDPPGGPTQ